ncbi:hypothetical protein O5547_20785 [Escherichia coli]|nr:hypothetical protein [Escherichia coli]
MGIITMQGIKISVASCCRDRQPRQIFTPAKLQKYFTLVGVMPIW